MSHYELAASGDEYKRQQRKELESSQSFLSLGLGIEGRIFETEMLTLNFTFQYSFFDTRKAFERFDSSDFEHNQGTRAIGVGFKLYFDPFSSSK